MSTFDWVSVGVALAAFVMVCVAIWMITATIRDQPRCRDTGVTICEPTDAGSYRCTAEKACNYDAGV